MRLVPVCRENRIAVLEVTTCSTCACVLHYPFTVSPYSFTLHHPVTATEDRSTLLIFCFTRR